ncbi:MAG: L-2-hydroxyglutarate oxidase [Microthrixaceae bacterium]
MSHPLTAGLDADVVVVGAGIVGMATARAVQERLGVREVLVLDKEDAPARHQTGRNSGVVHSGIYYAPGSAKARLVADGIGRLERRCAEWGVPYDRCGKLVVATRTEELARLEELARRGRANGVPFDRLPGDRIPTVEPHARGLAALHVRSTAVVDYPGVVRHLAEEVVASGGDVRTGHRVRGIEVLGDAVEVRTEAGDVRARWLVNCAGLHSDRVARMAGARTDVHIVPFRGEYHELVPAAAGLVRALVYPVPDPRWPFLGVHLTRGIDGSVHVGPNAVLALGREHYGGRGDRPDPGDVQELARDRGLWRLARRYGTTGAGELVRSRSRRLLLADVRRLVPEVGLADLVPAPAGIRAQAMTSAGELLDDFAFASSPRCVHVLNAPSPAATASLAIGDEVARRLGAVIG